MSGPSLMEQLSQAFPPAPRFTEKDLPDLLGKIYLVTGANTGVGKELAQILYSKNAKVYIAARSEAKALQAMDAIKQSEPSSSGELVFIRLDLADLSTIQASAQSFLERESKLHVLFNNAGVMKPAAGSKTAQGYEPQLGINNVGTFMFTKLLTPTLAATAKAEPRGAVRVAWVGSQAGEIPYFSPKGGVPMDNLDYHKELHWFTKYCISKAGGFLLGAEYARRHEADGILSVALHPGDLDSELWRSQPFVVAKMLKWFFLYPPINGAYTELFAGLSPDVTMEKSGGWIVPWGRFMRARKDLKEATKTKAEGGSGIAAEFWEWNEKQVQPYL